MQLFTVEISMELVFYKSIQSNSTAILMRRFTQNPQQKTLKSPDF